jgi:hypothetical protein
LLWIKASRAGGAENAPHPAAMRWGAEIMHEFGKRSVPVNSKPLSPEDLARWRIHAREVFSHMGPEHAPAETAMPHTPERRHSERHKTLIKAQVVFNDMMSTFDCSVRDLSAIGAHLKLHAPVEVPQAFLLRLSDGSIHQCKVTRRNALELGVVFIGEDHP